MGKSKPVIKCKCGANVTANTLKRHLRARCKLPLDEREWMRNVLNIKTLNQFAWIKSKGVEALMDKSWYTSVLNKDTNLSDWTFSAPRIYGQNRPEVIKKMKIDRTGSGNPVSKTKPMYEKKEIIEFASIYKKDYLETNKNPVEILKIINKEFPFFKWNWKKTKIKNKIRGHNPQNYLIAEIFDISINTVLSVNKKYRGKFISIGQRKSKKFMEFASEHGANMSSTWRVTVPHKHLFSIIRKHDKDAVIEYKLKYDSRTYSFDIHSPKINALIEMHGRCWHDIKKTTKSLVHITEKNSKNDILKENIARLLKYNFYKFWDDEQETWEKEVGAMYESK